MIAVTICSDFGAQENKVCHCFHCFPIYFPWSDGTSAYLTYMQSTSWEMLSWMKHKLESRLLDFLFLGSKTTTDGGRNHEIKRCLLLERKTMTNLDSIWKSRDITLSRKVRLVKAMVFPVVMYRCESWTVKKAEHQRIDAFELWCWRRLLRDPWTARRSNQSILREVSPEYSLEGLML